MKVPYPYDNLIEHGCETDVGEFIETETTLDLDEDDEVKVLWLHNGHIIAINDTKEWIINIETVVDDLTGHHTATDFETIEDDWFAFSFGRNRLKKFFNSTAHIEITV